MKSLIPSIIVAGLVIGGAIYFVSNGSKGATPDLANTGDGQNVSIVDGKQIIKITANGGYSPSVSLAKAGVPSVLAVKTSGTFDCSSALSIPTLNYREILPNSAETLIDIPAQESGTTIDGLCSMGMYNFQLKFD